MSVSVRFSLFLGVRVHHVTMEEAIAHVRALLRSEGPHQIVTLNASMLGQAARDERFRRIVNGAALVTPDGMGTLLVGRILGTRFGERVAGVDLTDRLCGLCAREGFRVFLLGAAPGIAEAAARRVSERHPGLEVAGTQHGYFGPAEEGAIIERIRASGARLLFVALGAPRQDEWLGAHLWETGAAVGMGVGGTFDVYAGRARLAPEWVRAIGMEWLYRLVREPRRWRVIATLPLVVLLAIRERVTRWTRAARDG